MLKKGWKGEAKSAPATDWLVAGRPGERVIAQGATGRTGRDSSTTPSAHGTLYKSPTAGMRRRLLLQPDPKTAKGRRWWPLTSSGTEPVSSCRRCSRGRSNPCRTYFVPGRVKIHLFNYYCTIQGPSLCFVWSITGLCDEHCWPVVATTTSQFERRLETSGVDLPAAAPQRVDNLFDA